MTPEDRERLLGEALGTGRSESPRRETMEEREYRGSSESRGSYSRGSEDDFVEQLRREASIRQRSMSETNIQSVAPYIEALIATNRPALIRAAVPDMELQDALLQINQQIERVMQRDPSLVGAWGLGCGGSCAAPAGGFLGLRIDQR